MHRLFFAGAFALAILALSTPAQAALRPPLPKAASSFDTGSIHVDVYGTPGKRAAIFIPGLTCGPWEWAGEIVQLAPAYTIYALTLPGFDGRPAIKGPLFQTVSADFWTMLQAHDIQKPILIGHSLGGTLGILLAEQHPGNLTGVIAVDGLPIFPGFEKLTVEQRAQAAARMSAAIASASTPQQFELIEKNYSLPYLMTSPADIAAVAPLTAKSDPQAVAAWASEDLTTDLRPQLAGISVPLLEIAPFDAMLDGKTFPTPDAKRKYYESLLAGDKAAKVQVIEPSRHFVMYDQPQKLHAAIVGLLQTL